MKKLLYLLSSLMLVFTACDPMEDVYEELDNQKDPFKKTGLTLKLVDADYKTSGKFYASEEAAVAAIPSILNRAFPQLENGSSVTVEFKMLSEQFKNNTVSKWEKYTVTEEDYLANGFRFKNFSKPEDMIKFLNTKYTAPEANQLIVLTFEYFSGTTKTVTDSFYYIDGEWVNVYHVTPENYEAVGSGRYKNFVAADAELLPAYFNFFLSDKVFGAEAGDIEYVSYTYFAGGAASQRILAMTYTGDKWVALPQTRAASLKFSKKNGEWVPDLTKSYTLVAADYLWISQQTSLGTSAQLSNLANFGNFYQSNSGSPNYWSNSNIIAALGALLKNKFPNEEVGQKFNVTYAYYAGGNKVNTVTLIKRLSGDYEIPNPDEL